MTTPAGAPEGSCAPLSEAKAAMRKAAKAALSAVEPSSRADWSLRASAVAMSTSAYTGSKLVLAFLSMPSEIDTAPIIEAALSDGKRVAVPRIDGGDIAFVELSSGWRAWPRDRWDIPAPPASSPVLSPAAIATIPTLALVPGLAFDDSGGRLGRGKGFYDRFLSKLTEARLLAGSDAALFAAYGYGYGIQLVERVPMAPLDRRLDGLALGSG